MSQRSVSKWILISQAVATVVWLVLIVPSVLWWKNSIVWVVIMSAWANFAGHLSAFIAALVDWHNQK